MNGAAGKEIDGTITEKVSGIEISGVKNSPVSGPVGHVGCSGGKTWKKCADFEYEITGQGVAIAVVENVLRSIAPVDFG